VLTVLLAAAGVVAGVTGAWSPCGFSMVETLAPAGYAGRLRTTVIACATFAVGALAGGVLTYGGLALLGQSLGTGAPAVAALVALAAAAGEARGARIVPQVRRQVPESWRRVLPVPLAAGLYGVLLGLGFTTFILSFAVWALAGIAVALGDPALGLAVGLGFGAGRALPVVAMAPSGGGALHAAMAERPRILRGLRALDAAALAACAVALVAAPASAQLYAAGTTDPSVDGSAIALHRPGANGVLRSPASNFTLPGTHPAIGGGHRAWVAGDSVVVDGAISIPAPGANALAVDASWVAWRAGGALWVASLGDAAPRQVVIGDPGRPALAGDLLLYDFARGTRIFAADLLTGEVTTLRRAADAQMRGVSADGSRIAYVYATYRRQQVRIGRLAAVSPSRDRAVYGTVPTGRRDAGDEPGHRHAPGHTPQLWRRPPPGVNDTLTTTALAPDAVYVTRLRQRRHDGVQAAVLRFAR
jgi:predicted nicotinamide N-methyase